MEKMTKEQLANMFDHTLLKPFATKEDFQRLCEDSKKYGFKMVAVNSAPVALCKEYLKGSGVHVGAAVSFPLGQTTIECKVFETKDAIANGADEIDYVINVAELKNKNYKYIKEEMERIVSVCREAGVISKVIFENCYLTKEEIQKAAQIAKEVKPDFIKTSTGFGTGGAAVEDVKLMKEHVGKGVRVKAAGGISSFADAEEFMRLGAERLGTSRLVKIMKQTDQGSGY